MRAQAASSIGVLARLKGGMRQLAMKGTGNGWASVDGEGRGGEGKGEPVGETCLLASPAAVRRAEVEGRAFIGGDGRGMSTAMAW